MTEEPYVIRMNIRHYEATLKLDMDERKRSTILQLLANARLALALAQSHESSTAKI